MLLDENNLANEIASLVLHKYSKLPSKGKPLQRSNGVKEWTILAGVVIGTGAGSLDCVALATGMKVLPNDDLDKCNGEMLHDMHAEILALRAFNRFVIDECLRVKTGGESIIVQPESSTSLNIPYLYRIKPDVKLYLYVSEAPCGDCSMSLVISAAENTEAWSDPLVRVGLKDSSDDLQVSVDAPDALAHPVRGRDHFDVLGLVRTKPGRRDSPVTFSKSCSDKLALRQFTSVLLGPVAKLVNPQWFYLTSLVVPESQLKLPDFVRAFGPTGRLSQYETLLDSFPDDYRPHFFTYLGTSLVFECSKDSVANGKSSFTSLVWLPSHPCESILGGVKMGSKPFSGKGQSLVCRKQLVYQVLRLDQQNQSIDSYLWYKQIRARSVTKQLVYGIMRGWISTKDDDFGLT